MNWAKDSNKESNDKMMYKKFKTAKKCWEWSIDAMFLPEGKEWRGRANMAWWSIIMLCSLATRGVGVGIKGISTNHSMWISTERKLTWGNQVGWQTCYISNTVRRLLRDTKHLLGIGTCSVNNPVKVTHIDLGCNRIFYFSGKLEKLFLAE